MRRWYFAVTSIVFVAGGVAAFTANPAISLHVTSAPGGIGPATKAAATEGIGSEVGSVTPRHDNMVRLAQAVTGQNNPSLAPFKWAGVLETPTNAEQEQNLGDAPYCTAQFITDSVLLTAGHCLNDLDDNPSGPGYDLTKASFILQYSDGNGVATFRVKCGRANPLWQYPNNYTKMSKSDQDNVFWTTAQHDFAMVLVEGTSPTGHISYALDWKGKYTSAVLIGYPEDILNGNYIQQTGGSVLFGNGLGAYYAHYPNLVVHLGTSDQFTYGSSGGAWVATDPITHVPTLIAATSAFPKSKTLAGANFAAYLTAAEFNPLLKSVSNGCK